MLADTVGQLEASLDTCMLRDRAACAAKLRAVRERAARNQPFDLALQRLSERIEESQALAALRRAAVPVVSYPQELPIAQKRDEIAAALQENQVIVVCGETGSGKTTQLPKICLELGHGVFGMIGHTQPRRIAARSVAARLSQELGTTLGGAVGYKVRFSDKSDESTTLVKLMTDGILLAETQSDRFLERYDTIIIDEAHERSLNIDFLLGYLRQLLPRRPDLKVIVTSATIDPQRFSRHFNDAPVVMVSGRTFPVELRYRPPPIDDPAALDLELDDAILRAIDELWTSNGPGDTLVFLTGEREIREVAELLRKHHPPDTEILPLFARLTGEEQMRVFQPHQRRRIVLATNVAETSLTVPGIRYVIDPGYARVSRYSSKTKVQRLPIEPISRASADQRKGRCGRVSEGVCVRLYSEDDFNGRTEFTEPQILRTNLAAVILQMKALRLGNITEFPFIDPPDTRAVRDGYGTLHEINALDERDELTEMGRMLARLPVDPRVGRMVLAAVDEGVLNDVLVIAAGLSAQDPRERPMDKQQLADAAHTEFRDPNSDFLSILKLWAWFADQQRHLSGSKLRKHCKESFISFIRMREWQDIHSQLLQTVGELKLRSQTAASNKPDAIHRALLAGLLSNIGSKSDSGDYHGARGSRFNIFPGSALFSRKPPWVMASEIVETSKLYARNVAPVRPEWIERLAAPLLKRTYSEPHWQAHSGHVMAHEKVTIFGLTLVPRRSVHYGPVDPKTSRQLFIQHALVDGDWYSPGKFFRHNRELLESVQEIENKSRRRDLLVETQVQFDFYDRRVPAGIYNGPLFEKWRRQAESQTPDVLLMTRQDLMRFDAEVAWDQFPDTLAVAGMVLPLEYRLDPGNPDDGVTAVVPLAALNQLPVEMFEWLVPGLLKERVIALIRSLPKQLRTNFVPVPDHAESALRSFKTRAGSLHDVLAETLNKQAGTSISRFDFQIDALPDHLRMNFRVIDAQGKAVSTGRDLLALRQQSGVAAQSHFSDGAEEALRRDNLTTWDFGNLPARVPIVRHGIELTGYPALIDRDHSVSVRVLDTPVAAAASTRAGLTRLLVLQLGRELEALARRREIDELLLAHAALGDTERFRQDLIFAAADRALHGSGDEIRSRETFVNAADRAWRKLPATLDELIELCRQILSARHSIALGLAESFPPLLQPALHDLRQQLMALTPSRFLVTTPPEWLPQLPRFLEAMLVRLKKLTNAGLARDQQALERLQPYLTRFADRVADHAKRKLRDPELITARWMLQEFRVSLFAQELKTSIPISPQRLDRQFELIQP